MKLALKIANIRDETNRIRVFDLVAPEGSALPRYSPGAHLTFDLGQRGTRSYSLINWPSANKTSNLYQIAVQHEEDGSGGSKRMHSLSVGDLLEAEGPKNNFALSGSPGPVLLLAGGIGVTPLISMATHLTQTQRPFTFVYAARSQEVAGFTGLMKSAFGPALTLAFDDVAPLDLGRLMAGLTRDTQIYICGPIGLIEAARAAAIAAELPKEQIHVELFSTPAPETGDTAFEVEITSTGQVFDIQPGQTIIDVLEDAGVDVMYDCQRGDCGICQTDVISGIPDHRDVVLSQAEREEGKLMQICVSRAKSPRLVLDL